MLEFNGEKIEATCFKQLQKLYTCLSIGYHHLTIAFSTLFFVYFALVEHEGKLTYFVG